MLKISKEANENYLAEIIEIKNIKKHPNADRLQTVDINFRNVITGMDAKNGDIYVYFPVESKISKDFLASTNSFRDSSKNIHPEVTGFFDDNCRVRAMKLRGEKSMGYIVPFNIVLGWAKNPIPMSSEFKEYIGQRFDTINGLKICEKYIIKTNESNKVKQGKSSTLSRLIEGQVNFHVNTPNLRKEIKTLKPNDLVSVTYKTHGTSWWSGNLLTKKKLNLFQRFLKFLGISILNKEYSNVYGSRRVVKSEQFNDPKNKNHYYNYNLWEEINNVVKNIIPEGFTLYGEALGYTKDDGYIQKDYDYSCEKGQFKLEVYRITHTTSDGLVTELSYPQIVDFCKRSSLDILEPSHLFFYGKLENLYPKIKGTKH